MAQCMKDNCINRPSIESVIATLLKLNAENTNDYSTVERDNQAIHN